MLRDKFCKDADAPKLGQRFTGFIQMMGHLDLLEAANIIETGTVRRLNSWGPEGMSTHWWAWAKRLKPELKVWSVDISEKAVSLSQAA